MTKSLRNWVTEHRQELVDLTMSLVAIPSENHPPNGDERAFQEYFARVLQDTGCMVEQHCPGDVKDLDQHVLYWPGRNYTDRPNVVGRLRGGGQGRSLLFCGHGDVVQGIEGKYPPFNPVVIGDRLMGRGAYDMKGGMAAVIMAIRGLRALNIRLAGDVLIESDVDEEMGGSNGTLSSRLMGYRADAAIIPEPSEEAICPAHRGGSIWRLTVQGSGGMGFAGEEMINPIYGMGRLIEAIHTFAGEWRERRSALPIFQGARGLDVVLSIAQAGEFPLGQGNGVPRQAALEVWVESYPDMSFKTLETAFLSYCRRLASHDSILSRCQLQIDQVVRYLPGSYISADHDLVRTVAQVVEDQWGARRVHVTAAPFACDAFVLNAFGIPSVILGAKGGNAHGADEFVSISSLVDLTVIYAEILMQWCGVNET